MKIIGITGGIASGKSTAANFIRQKYDVIDCDEISHELYTDSNYIRLVINTFGESILTSNKIDKQKIRCLVFSSSENLKRLNDITCPLIIKKLNEKIERFYRIGKNVVFIESPILFESNLQMFVNFDEIWLVAISPETQLKRLKERNPDIDDNTCHNILNNQLPLEIKLKNSNKVFWNEGRLEELHKKVDKELLNLQL